MISRSHRDLTELVCVADVAEHENPADWMIDVCSGLETRYDDSGAEDRAFACPADLYRVWEEKHAASALSPDSPFHKGDPAYDPTTGVGYVERHDGHYADARSPTKNNMVLVAVVEAFGGTCPSLLRWLKYSARRASVSLRIQPHARRFDPNFAQTHCSASHPIRLSRPRRAANFLCFANSKSLFRNILRSPQLKDEPSRTSAT